MKIVYLVTGSLLMSLVQGAGQIVLTAGNSYTYQFTNLVFQNNSTSNISGPSGTVFLYVEPTDPTSLGPTNSYKVEMFEDSPAQAPVLVRTITSASSIFDTDYRATNVWGDLQGSIRITALTGSITLRGFSFQAIKKGNPTGFDIYGTERIFLPRPPVLSVVSSNSNLTISWLASETNFVLESASSPVLPGSWTPVTNAVILSGGRQSLTIGPGEANRFFRLKWNGPR